MLVAVTAQLRTARRLAAALAAALMMHHEHVSLPCPVCTLTEADLLGGARS